MRQRTDWLILLAALILVLITRLPAINSGLNIMEGDEWLYQSIAQTLSSGNWPMWQGVIFLQRHPSFLYLGYGISQLFTSTITVGPYINLRLISVATDLLFTYCLWRLYRQLNIPAGISLISLILITILPLHWFFARQGTYEMFLSACAMLFLTTFLSWLESPTRRLSIMVGATLAIALAAKFTNSLLVAVFFPLLLAGKWQKNFPRLGFVALITGLVFTGLVLPMVFKSPVGFISQFFFGFYGLYWPFRLRTFLAIWWEYVKFLPIWFSWPIIIWSLIGLGVTIKKPTRISLTFLVGLLTSLVYLGLYYLNDRIAIILLPWAGIFAAWGLSAAFGKLPRTLFWTLASLSVIITGYQGLIAYQSSRHTAREVALAQIIKLHRQYPALPVFTTIDPPKTIGSLPELKVQLLNKSATSSGIILSDQLSSPVILNLTEAPYVEAKRTLALIKSSAEPIYSLVDPLPHFPWNLGGNVYSIYLVNPGTSTIAR